jgi:hypothetical protein
LFLPDRELVFSPRRLTLAVKFDVLCNVEAVAVSWRCIGGQSVAFYKPSSSGVSPFGIPAGIFAFPIGADAGGRLAEPCRVLCTKCQVGDAEILHGRRARSAKRHKELAGDKNGDVVRGETQEDGGTVGINAGRQSGDV